MLGLVPKTVARSSQALRTHTPSVTARFYQSRLTAEAFFQGKGLVETTADTADDGAAYVVEDSTPPPFKSKDGVKVLGFKYPGAAAPDNKTLYAIAPRKPPMVLSGVSGDYVNNLYLASMARDALMKTESELVKFVLPLTEDPELQEKFFGNTTIDIEEKTKAVEAYVKDNKLSEITEALMLEVVETGQSDSLAEIVETYVALMKKVRCEATADVTFGRIPTKNELIKVKQLVNDLRSPTQYYVQKKFTVDPDIGGGLVLKMGDFEVDGSMNTRTAEVQKHLVKSLQA